MAKTAQEKLDAKREKEYNKKHKRMYRRSVGDVVFDVLNYIFFTVFTLTCIFPFYYLFINTISSNDLVKKGMINFYPKGLNIDNYLKLREVGICQQNDSWYCIDGPCFCIRWLLGNKAGNVA